MGSSGDLHTVKTPRPRGSISSKTADNINHFLKTTTGWIPARIALAILSWFGFINLYMTRVNLSVIIVAMAKRNVSSGISTPCLAGDIGNQSLHGVDGYQNESQTEIPSFPEQGESEIIEWPETIQGIVLGSFYYGYLMTQLLGGRLAEIYGTKYVFGGCIFAGGICALLSPTVAKLHYGAFIALRVIQGFLQGFSWPSMHALISRWIPPFERPRFVAIVYLGATLSTAITLSLCSIIIDNHGWPAAFYVCGTLSLLWCIVWYFLMYNYPSQHPRISARELEFIENAIGTSGTSAKNRLRAQVPWKSIFTSVPMWAIIIGELGNDWGISMFFTQLPSYMKNVLGFSIRENGMMSALPFVTRYIGAVSLSILADQIITKGYMSIRNTRRLFSAIAMWSPAFMLIGVIYSGCQAKTILILLCAGLFVNGGMAASITVNHTDIAPNFAGTLFGISNTTSSLISFVQPVIAGIMLDGQQTIEQWQKVFWMCVPMYLCLNIFYLIFCSGTVQSWNYVKLDEERTVKFTEDSQDTKPNPEFAT